MSALLEQLEAAAAEGLGPALAQLARWHSLSWDVLAIATTLTFAAASSLAVAGRQR